MCGIAGVIAPIEFERLNVIISNATNKLKHRGPDAAGYYIKSGVALGHRRLSIIDLNTRANQPFIDASGRYVIVFNGEIYNYREIKSRLPDYNFVTSSDTEVILAAFIQWGAKCLEHLNGMFAFAIWDEQEKKLFVCRDRLGVKPLYYHHKGDQFLFASELRSLTSTGIFAKEIDDASIDDYLMNQAITAPYSLFKDVYQLLPGQYGIFHNRDFNIFDYWRIEDMIEFPDINDLAPVKKQIRRLLTESVERRMISDVDLGAFLSGGIDSSIIVALMAEISNSPVNTFSINFDEKEFDESRFSNLVAKRYRTRHYPITLTADDCLNELPAALSAMDTPSGDGMNSFMVSKATQQAGFTVALSGMGGDELFAGYPHFSLFYKLHQNKALRALHRVFGKPAAAATGIFWHGIKADRFVDMMASHDLEIEHQYTILKQVYSVRAASRILKNDGYPNRVKQLISLRRSKIHRLPVLSQYSVAELLGYTQNVLLKDLDQMSMANSLEVREPFFDYKLVEYTVQIPDHLKYPTYPKSLLVESFNELLPDEIIHRRKMGFVFPWDKWLRNELKTFVEMQLNSLAKREQFAAEEIIKLWSMFLQNRGGVKWIHIWQLVVLSVYLTENLD